MDTFKIRYSYEMTKQGFTFVFYRNNVVDNKTNKFSQLELTVISLIKSDKSLSASLIAEKTYKSSSTIQRTLKLLTEKRYIKHEGPDNGGYLVVLK